MSVAEITPAVAADPSDPFGGPDPGAVFPDETDRQAEQAYRERQQAADSYGAWIAQQAAELESDAEPAFYHEPTDEDLCRVR